MIEIPGVMIGYNCISRCRPMEVAISRARWLV